MTHHPSTPRTAAAAAAAGSVAPGFARKQPPGRRRLSPSYTPQLSPHGGSLHHAQRSKAGAGGAVASRKAGARAPAPPGFTPSSTDTISPRGGSLDHAHGILRRSARRKESQRCRSPSRLAPRIKPPRFAPPRAGVGGGFAAPDAGPAAGRAAATPPSRPGRRHPAACRGFAATPGLPLLRGTPLILKHPPRTTHAAFPPAGCGGVQPPPGFPARTVRRHPAAYRGHGAWPQTEQQQQPRTSTRPTRAGVVGGRPL